MVSEIVEDRLYLGDVDDGRHADEYADFDRVITVGDNISHEHTTDQFIIPDGGWKFEPETDYDTFRTAVNTLRGSLERGESVLVHCRMGQSRSPGVVIAAMATLDGAGFNKAYNEVKEKRGVINLSPEIRHCAKRFIDSYNTIHNRDDN